MKYIEVYEDNGIEKELVDVQAVKDRSRAERRHRNVKKALRKRRISRAVNGCDYYNNIHQYSDNKIHCSCPLCRFVGPSHSDMKKNGQFSYQDNEMA